MASGGEHEGLGFSPRPGFPQDPEFYRRVLDHLPTPVVLLDEEGRFAYGNDRARDLVGITADDGIGRSAFDFAHPDDAAWIAEAFLSVVEHRSSVERPESGAVLFRLVATDGTVVPVELLGGVVGNDSSDVLYSINPIWGPALLDEIIAGLARGAGAEELVALVVQLTVIPPITVDAALLDVTDPGRVAVVATSATTLSDALTSTGEAGPWSDAAEEPAAVLVEDLPGSLAAALSGAGYRDLWHVAVPAPDADRSLRLVAASPLRNEFPTTMLQRLERSRDLMAVVLQKATDDEATTWAAYHDALTRLPNRSAFYRRLDALHDEHRAVGLLYLDLDGFKAINDRLGHAAGDEVLVAVAARLQATTRPADLVARLGGDEFAVVVPPPVTAESLAQLADRLRAHIGEPIAVRGSPQPVAVGASIGVVLAPDGAEPDPLVRLADEGMYRAKTGEATAVRVLGG